MKTTKATRIFLIATIIVASLFAVILFAGCKKAFLAIPDPEFNETEYRIEWAKVENAKDYLVNVYKGEKPDKQLLIFSAQQDKTSHSLSNYSNTITVGVSSVGYGDFNSSSQKNMTIDLKKMTIISPGQDDDDDDKGNVSNEPIIITDVVKSLSNIFYSKSDVLKGRDVKIKFESKVVSLDAFQLSPSDWSFDENKNILTIKAKYFSRFAAGAKPQFVASLVGNITANFYVQVVNVLPYEIRQSESIDTQGKLVYVKTDSMVGLSIKLFDEYGKQCEVSPAKKVCIDGKEIGFDWIPGAGYYFINIKKDDMDKIFVGEHTLQVFTNQGKSEVVLVVDAKVDIAPYDVFVDYESNYPYFYLKWQSKNANKQKIQDIVVTINNKVYARSDEFYTEYFSDNCLDLTSLLLPKSQLDIKVAIKIDGQLYTSSEIIYQNVPDDSLVKYFTTTYDYFGKTINLYLQNYEEVKELIYYIILNYDSLTPYNGTQLDDKGKPYKKVVNLYYENGSEKFYTDIKKARLSFPEAISWYVAIVNKESKPNEISFCLTIRSTVKPTLTTQSPTCNNEEKNNDTQFGQGKRKEKYASYEDVPFKIMSQTEMVLANSTTEMVMAMEQGLRPKFLVGSVAEQTYISAKKILYQIIDDEMSDYQKVAAIYDWLSNNVMYDYKIAKLTESISPIDDKYINLYFNKSFFAEGVFQNNLAVCNGIAQAFVILCRIEGIAAYKISGQANGGLHAWNKVVIDNSWYICDPTWASKSIDYNGDGEVDSEVLSKNTLFMTTQSSGSKEHKEDDKSEYKTHYSGDCNYNYYANLYYKNDDDSYFENETNEDGSPKTDESGNEIVNINDLIFDDKKKANIYMQTMVNKMSSQQSFIVSFLIPTARENAFLFNIPLGYKAQHFATRTTDLIGITRREGQYYQYGASLFVPSEYLLYIIKLTKN